MVFSICSVWLLVLVGSVWLVGCSGEPDRGWTQEAGEDYTNDNFYYTDAITDYAGRYVEEHAQKQSENPFFLYVAYTAPHWPLHASQETIEKYEGTFDVGWDSLRQRRDDRMTEMGLIDKE